MQGTVHGHKSKYDNSEIWHWQTIREIIARVLDIRTNKSSDRILQSSLL